MNILNTISAISVALGVGMIAKEHLQIAIAIIAYGVFSIMFNARKN